MVKKDHGKIIKESFSRNLRVLRTAAGLSQGELAELVWPEKNPDVGKVQISKYERGLADPRARTKEALAAALKVSPILLVGAAIMPADIDAGLPKDPEAVEVGRRIKSGREALGLSRAELVEKIGMAEFSEHELTWYEEGVAVPTGAYLFGLVQALNTSEEELLGRQLVTDGEGETGEGDSLDFNAQMLDATRQQLRATQDQVEALLREVRRLKKENNLLRGAQDKKSGAD